MKKKLQRQLAWLESKGAHASDHSLHHLYADIQRRLNRVECLERRAQALQSGEWAKLTTRKP